MPLMSGESRLCGSGEPLLSAVPRISGESHIWGGSDIRGTVS